MFRHPHFYYISMKSICSRIVLSVVTLITIYIIVLSVISCTNNNAQKDSIANDFDIIKSQGTLRVLTLSSSTSYFIYKGEEHGYEYEVISQFAADNGLKVEMIVADNMAHLMQMLNDSVGDIVAYEVPLTGDTKDEVLHCGPMRISEQVLVQRDINPIADVTELVGKDVYVEKGSKYEERLNNLNAELGGGIKIHHINRDTVVTEDLIEMVATGEIPYTVADANLAKLNLTYYNNLDIYVKVSFPQRSQWAVRHNSQQLAQAIDTWTAESYQSEQIRAINKRYFESSKKISSSSILSVADGRISEYDEIFKREANRIGWDWRLLAAMAYHESRFDSSVVSWVGARGIMQLMPATAVAFGLDIDSIAVPAHNVRIAVETLKSLDNSLQSVDNDEERQKFILAAYNAGIGHVFDAMAIARKYDKNAQIWYGEVEEAMLMKANPEYYNDDVCRLGYFRGRQTTTYVRDVVTLYKYYCEKIPK